MALGKKGTEKETKKSYPERYTFPWSTIDEVIASAIAGSETVTYQLTGVKGMVQATVNEEKMWIKFDFCGLVFFTQIKQKKEGGYFVSFPSFKDSKGEWKDVISMYDKNFHALIRELLEKLTA